MNISKHLFRLATIVVTAGGAIFFAAPASASETQSTCDLASTESEQTECLAPIASASFASFCDTLLLINEADVTLTFELGINGFDGITEVPAHQSLEVSANYGDDAQTEIAAYDGEFLVFSGTAKPSPEHCQSTEPVLQTITANVVLDCIGVPVSGSITFGIPEPVDSILNVEASNAEGTKGGQVYEGVVIPAGTTSYVLSATEIAAIASTLELNSNLVTLTGYLTTEKGGGFTTFPIPLVNAPKCQEPVFEPEASLWLTCSNLESGLRISSFIHNAPNGSVVHLYNGALQEIVLGDRITETEILSWSIDGINDVSTAWMIDMSTSFVVCGDVFLPPTDTEVAVGLPPVPSIPPVDPMSVTLPETGAASTITMLFMALGLVTAGAACLSVRRRTA